MNTTTKPISSTTANKINQAIQECDRFIALESKRSSDLRPAGIQQHLGFCIAHKAKLLQMLEGGAGMSLPGEMIAQLADYGICIQYGRNDVDYGTWYSAWSKALAEKHTLTELDRMLLGNRRSAVPAGMSHLRAVDATHSMQSQSQRRAQTGNVVRAIGETASAIRGAIEIHFLFPEHARCQGKKL